MAGVIERLDERGRVTIKPRYRDVLKEGYVQVLTREGVLFRRVSSRPLRTKAPALEDVDAEGMKGL